MAYGLKHALILVSKNSRLSITVIPFRYCVKRLKFLKALWENINFNYYSEDILGTRQNIHDGVFFMRIVKGF